MDGDEIQQDESDSGQQQEAEFNAFDPPASEDAGTEQPAKSDNGETLTVRQEKTAASDNKDAAATPEKKGIAGRLAAVKEVMGIGPKKDKPGKKAKASGEDGGDEQNPAADAEKKAAEGKDKDGRPVIPEAVAKHPAFIQVQREAETLRGAAREHQKTVSFLQENGIPAADYERGVNLMALSKRDPQKFVGELRALLGQWEEHLNIRLPADIQERVDNGELSEEAAKELNAGRVKTRMLEGQQKQTQNVMSQRETQEYNRETDQIVDNFLKEAGKTDPHLAGKAEAMAGEMLRLKQRFGEPKTAQQKYNLIQAAYGNVNKRMGADKRPKTPTPKTPPSSGHGPSGTAIPATAPFKTKMNAQIKNILKKQG